MFRIKKLDIFILRQFMLLFVGTFFVSMFVLMMQFLWKYVDDLIGKGLTLDVLGQFFGYMSLMLVPQALPLALLLSSLITFGNLGESSELTAIKAAGISLMQSFRALIVFSVFIMLVSFVFQNNIGPKASQKISQLLISMKQKSPELEIPEGVFYDGIPECNIYVQRKDLKTGKLYGVMIYRMTGSYEDQAIILADSGMMQSTAEKKHLLLTLYSGEWFENMKSSEFAGSAAVPYRRETFTTKKIVLDFDGDFSMTNAAGLSNNAAGKSLAELRSDVDSLTQHYDSIGRAYMDMANRSYYRKEDISKSDSIVAAKTIMAKKVNFDTLFNRLPDMEKLTTVNTSLSRVQQESMDLEFKQLITSDGDWLIRRHRIEEWKKFTLALSCLIFFFIGASLGSIIRKGGLGVPIIVAVLVYIVYYIFDNTGYTMSKGGSWAVWFGMSLSPAVLIPLAAFITYKANNDSMVFNFDVWKDVLSRMLGLRQKRHVYGKEVIIQEPDYAKDAAILSRMNDEIVSYSHAHNLRSAPNVIKVFFRYEPDHEIERMSEELEGVIEDLSNTRDKVVMTLLNHYPIMATKAHTRPFERRWKNIVAAVIVPAGLFFYFRMWRFRWRLLKDLRVIRQTNANMVSRIDNMLAVDGKKESSK